MSEYCDYDNKWGQDTELPFFDDVELITWKWPNGSYIKIDKTTDGWHVYGLFVVGEGKSNKRLHFRDNDGEDFFCSTSDELLDLLTKYGLHKLLTATSNCTPPEVLKD